MGEPRGHDGITQTGCHLFFHKKHTLTSPSEYAAVVPRSWDEGDDGGRVDNGH